MADILDFPASAQAGDQRRGQFFDPDLWRVSKRGNSYTRTTDGFCVTCFVSWGGYRWSIAHTAAERPVFSTVIYASEGEARRAAWTALAALEEKRA